MNHDLKEWPEQFGALVGKLRKHEVRFHDRDFKLGDTLTIREYNPVANFYTGRVAVCKVTSFQIIPAMAETVCSMDVALESTFMEEPHSGV